MRALVTGAGGFIGSFLVPELLRQDYTVRALFLPREDASRTAALGFNRNQAGLDEEAERVRTGIPYCDTKIEAEDLVAAFCPEHQIPYTIIRPAIVKAIQKRRFIVIPGKMARLVYCGHRLTLGLTTRFTSDRVIRYVQAKRRR